MKEVLEQFRKRQEEIVGLQKTLKEKEEDLQKKVDQFILDNKSAVNSAGKVLEEKLSQYRADCKAMFGLADGEQTNVLEVVACIANVVEKMK